MRHLATLLSLLVLATGCRREPADARAEAAAPDSARVARAALAEFRRDQAAGGGERYPLRVLSMKRDSAGYLVGLSHADPGVLGGGGLVRIDLRGQAKVLERWQ